MKASFYQRGESLDFTNATDAVIEAGTVVEFGARIGVAGTTMAPGELGSLHVEGVFRLPKAEDAVLAAGAEVFLTADGIATAGTKKAGYVAEAAAASDTTVLVKINA